MTDQILDSEASEEPFVQYRKLALILEFFPLLIGILGIILEVPQLTTIGLGTGAVIYPLFAWYLFKTSKHNIWDILFATIFGFGIFIILVGLLWYFQKWEGAKEMVIAAHLMLMIGSGLSLVHCIIRILLVKNKKEEFRMSFKILSRYLFLLILFYTLNLDEFMETVLIEI